MNDLSGLNVTEVQGVQNDLWIKIKIDRMNRVQRVGDATTEGTAGVVLKGK